MSKTIYTTWPEVDQQRFDQRRAIFDNWTDFLVSYTNRDATAINNRYKTLISHTLGWPSSKAQRESINYVARVLAKFLERKSIRGFVDFKSLKCGDDIEAEILDHCQTTIAFVQLIEEAALTEPKPPMENWCFKEHAAFAAASLPAQVPVGIGNRYFFFVGGAKKLSAPPGMGTLYGDWFKQMAATLHIVIDDYNYKPFDDLNSEVEKIACQIVETRKQLFESMLATWP